MPPPYAIRVKTETGWQDIAIQGATGDQGIQGPQGIQGLTGPPSAVAQPGPPTPRNEVVLWVDTDEPMPPYVVSGPSLVTTLPSSPIDGQEVYYLADAANGVVWHLRYRAVSASAYKWEYLGGPPLTAINPNTSTGITGNTLVRPSQTVSITLQLAGDYIMSWWTAGPNNTAGAYSFISAVVAAIGFALESPAGAYFVAPSAGFYGQITRTERINGRTAGQVIEVWARASSGTFTPNYIGLSVMPVRVG
jgi:hypothetical protein